jgi:hypothetical protein
MMRIVALAFLLAPFVATAEPLVLSLPVACRLGESCWVMNYVDDDPGLAARDFRCRPRSYDGHDGTDFAIRDAVAMAKGIGVVAAADGIVQGSRDGEPDGVYAGGDKAAVTGKECGNGLVLRHDGGLETQYCHLRRGSLVVAKGERVSRGQALGLVGSSGMSAFPHLHLTVRRDGKPLDPFTGQAASEGCGQAGRPLWAEAPPYEAAALYAAGFSDHLPSDTEIKADAASRAPRRDQPLLLWGALFGAAPGDTVRLRITGPGGVAVVDHSEKLDRAQAWAFRTAGRKPPAGGWPPGSYDGEATLTRDGEPPQLRRLTAEMR